MFEHKHKPFLYPWYMQSATNCYTGGILIGYDMTFKRKKMGGNAQYVKKSFQ